MLKNPLRNSALSAVKFRLLALLICMLLPLVLTACADSVPPADIARRYLGYVRDNGFSQAYDLLTADSQLKVSRSQFVDRLNRAHQEAGIIKTDLVKVLDPNIVGKRASVAYQLEVTLQSGQKLSLYESMVLLQQDMGWRVVWPPD